MYAFISPVLLNLIKVCVHRPQMACPWELGELSLMLGTLEVRMGTCVPWKAETPEESCRASQVGHWPDLSGTPLEEKGDDRQRQLDPENKPHEETMRPGGQDAL